MLELDFLDCRSRLLEVAAFLDRIDRYPDAELARSDFRYRAVIDLVEVIHSGRQQRTLEMLTLLSEPISCRPARRSGHGGIVIIDPHIHMVSRTTDDYAALALHGIKVVTEPAFWAGYDRKTADGFADYFEQLTVTEPARAARFGVRHYCWLCLNPKEAVDLTLAREVLQILPQYLDRPSVLGIGEIGLNRNGVNEVKVLEWQVEMAAERNELVLVHTPHMEDKLKGTRLILDVIANEPRLHPDRVLIDHAEEHTIRIIRDRGCWVGITLYPLTKCTPARAVDMLETAGFSRVWLNSAADWGISDPLAVAKAGAEMRRRGIKPQQISDVLYGNPVSFLSQSPRFAAPC